MKREIKRVFRKGSPAEIARVRKARAETEAEKEELLATASKFKELDADKRPPTRKKKMPIVGELLKARRLRAGLSQTELAARAAALPQAAELRVVAGTLQNAISRIEDGRTANPGVLTIGLLAAGMGLSQQDFWEGV